MNIKVLCKHCGKETDYSPKGGMIPKTPRPKCMHCKKRFHIDKNYVQKMKNKIGHERKNGHGKLKSSEEIKRCKK
ncbi:MAG: hypothetical protein ACTSR8_04295 [Promethearchaeota archaeon]